VDSETATRLGLTLGPAGGHAGGPTGTRVAVRPVVHPLTLAIGSTQHRVRDATSLDLYGYAGKEGSWHENLAGFLGLTFLRDRSVVFDFARGSLSPGDRRGDGRA
jgi:hypothetical protein